jgi:hypothetical protein
MLNMKQRSLENKGTVDPVKPEQSALSALKHSDLSGLIQQAEKQALMDRELRRNLPPALAKQCRLSSFDGDKLVFLASNPVWKNKLRLHSQQILELARTAGLHARSLKISVDLSFQPEPTE